MSDKMSPRKPRNQNTRNLDKISLEEASILGLKRQVSDRPPRYDLPPASNHTRSESVRQANGGNTHDKSRIKSSGLMPSGSQDPLIGSSRSNRDFSESIYDRSQNEITRLVTDKLSRFENLPRLTVKKTSIRDINNDFSDDSIQASFTSYGKYDRDIDGQKRSMRQSRRDKMPKVIPDDDMTVTKHVCNCDMLGGKTHIHKVGEQVIIKLIILNIKNKNKNEKKEMTNV